MIRTRSDDDGTARLILDRPEARNALTRAGWRALGEAAGALGRGGARLVLIEGTSGAFCAGADLKEFAGIRAEPDGAADFRAAMRAGIEAVAALPMPVIARVDGACYGAGVALALAADLILAGPDARFAVTPARIGLSYPQADVARLVARVGPGRAGRLLLGAGAIGAEEALRIGLADEGGDGAGLIAAILANADQSLAALKAAIRRAVDVAGDAQADARFDRLFHGDEPARRLGLP